MPKNIFQCTKCGKRRRKDAAAMDAIGNVVGVYIDVDQVDVSPGSVEMCADEPNFYTDSEAEDN